MKDGSRFGLQECPKVSFTQIVEIVPGEQSQLLDTCLVRYVIENQDDKPHRVGLRFLLDTYIGDNDGVPFTIPGDSQLCDTMKEFNDKDKIPDFIQALEKEDLEKPGTVARVQLKVGGKIEPPDRVTLGAWPNIKLHNSRCLEQHTLWEVPVLPMKTLDPHDSAVTIYWNEKTLEPGQSREVGFAYGLGQIASGESGGKLAVTVGGDFRKGGEFTVTALVKNPVPGEKVTLKLPGGLDLVNPSAEQLVPPLSAGVDSKSSPVTWKVRGAELGRHTLRVQSSTGAGQSQPVVIFTSGLFQVASGSKLAVTVGGPYKVDDEFTVTALVKTRAEREGGTELACRPRTGESECRATCAAAAGQWPEREQSRDLES